MEDPNAEWVSWNALFFNPKWIIVGLYAFQIHSLNGMNGLKKRKRHKFSLKIITYYIFKPKNII